MMDYKNLLRYLFNEYDVNTRESESLMHVLSQAQAKALYKMLQKIAIRAAMREIVKKDV